MTPAQYAALAAEQIVLVPCRIVPLSAGLRDAGDYLKVATIDPRGATKFYVPTAGVIADDAVIAALCGAHGRILPRQAA